MKSDIPSVVGPYNCIYKLGSGSFSDVYQAIEPQSGQQVALKFINRKILKKQRILRTIEREVRISERLNHKSIVTFQKVYFLDNYIVLAMECLGNGTLASFIQSSFFKLEYSVYLGWGKDILEGLQYLHSKNISHHDIKPENIGFDSFMNAKILDLGLCEEFGDVLCTCNCGTPLFSAPELLLGIPYDGRKSDIWSFGVTFHLLVTSQFPFDNQSNLKVIKSREDIKKCVHNYCEGPLKEIIDLALTIEPEKRPTADELLSLEIFKHAEIHAPEPLFERVKQKPKSHKNLIVSPLIRNRRNISRRVSGGDIIRKYPLIA